MFEEEIKEVTKALTLIQKICKNNYTCGDTCPFCKNGTCVIQDGAPEDWKIDTNPTISWKAFE